MKPIRSILLFAFAFLGFAHAHEGPTSTQADLVCSFASDTFWVCVGETYRINPQVSGGVSPYTYSWGDGTSPGTPGNAYLDILHSSVGTDTVELVVTDLLGEQCTSTIIVQSLGDCVWPGDANGNGIANHVDLLNIGRGMGFKGPLRPLGHTNWIGQATHAWGTHAPDGADFAHADADGDGEVHMLDIDAILKNYTFTPAISQTTGNQGPPFVLEYSDSTVSAGDTLYISVMLGDSANPVDSVYGLAFSITYDTWLVDSGSVTLDLNGSWLGQDGVDMTGMAQDFAQAGQLDVAVTRLDQAERAGYGKAVGIIVTIEDIVGKTSQDVLGAIRLSGIQLEKFNGNQRDVHVDPSLLSGGIDVGLIENNDESGVEIFPNPAKSSINITSDKGYIQSLRLYNALGQQVTAMVTSNRSQNLRWKFPQGLNGSFYLKIKTSEGLQTRPLTIIN